MVSFESVLFVNLSMKDPVGINVLIFHLNNNNVFLLEIRFTRVLVKLLFHSPTFYPIWQLLPKNRKTN